MSYSKWYPFNIIIGTLVIVSLAICLFMIILNVANIWYAVPAGILIFALVLSHIVAKSAMN